MASMILGGFLGVGFRLAFEHYWTKVLDKGEPPIALSYLFVIIGGATGGILGSFLK